MARFKSKFETEVHFGLLVIIFILLFVNFISNVVLYRARVSQAVIAEQNVRSATAAITRMLRDNDKQSLPHNQLSKLRQDYSLTDVMLIDSQPGDSESETERKWFVQLVSNFPPERVPELARILTGVEMQHLARGVKQEYFFVTPVSFNDRRQLLVLRVNLPQLAYLEDAGFIIQLAAAGSFIAVLVVYLALSRHIFGPVRRITQKARKAGRPVDDSENEFEGVAEDYEQIIEELRRNQAELLRLNDETRTRAESLELFNEYLLASIDSGIVTLSGEGIVLSDNEAARRLLGSDDESLKDADYRSLFSGSTELVELIGEALKTGEVATYRELMWKDSGRTQKEFGISLSIIRDNHQQKVGLAVLINDLTELHGLRRVLDQQKRLVALGEMAGGLAHQIRNSLGAISGFATLVAKRTEAENILSVTESLLQETREAGTLISRFLTFARPLSIERRPIHIADLLDEIVNGFRVRPPCARMEFELECDERLLFDCDPVLLKQAVSNIIDNAVRACEGMSGLIRIAAALNDDELTIKIEDSGSGIPEDEIEKLFTPFFSSRPSGSGLGLSLAAKIIDLHHGRIMVESQVGKGSSFTIRLPLSIERKTETESLRADYDLHIER